jgi:hypothetical protein
VFVPSLSWEIDRFEWNNVAPRRRLSHRDASKAENRRRDIHLRKTAFLSHLYIKTIILPRQARDKHRENSKKDAVFRTH